MAFTLTFLAEFFFLLAFLMLFSSAAITKIFF